MANFRLGFALFTTIFLTLIASEAARAAITDSEEKKMIERINHRYDDFFRRQRQEEEQREQRMSGVKGLEQKRQEHEKALRKAREQYVLNHKTHKQDPKLEVEWNEAQKARHEQSRINGERYLEREMHVEAIQSRGRKIPPDVEYDLNN